MRLVVQKEGELYRLWVEHGDVRRPLLVPGETPSWAGGWAGVDGAGAYQRDEAVTALRAFGLSRRMVDGALLEPEEKARAAASDALVEQSPP